MKKVFPLLSRACVHSFAALARSQAALVLSCAALALSLFACTETTTETLIDETSSSGEESIKDMVTSCNTSQKGNTVNLKLEVKDWSLKSVVTFDSTTVHEEYTLEGNYGEWANRICGQVTSNDEMYECNGNVITGDCTVGSCSRKFFDYLDDISLCSKLTMNQVTLEEFLLE